MSAIWIGLNNKTILNEDYILDESEIIEFSKVGNNLSEFFCFDSFSFVALELD